MKIIILGAGQVGGSVATNLANEANDITVVDENPAILQDLQDRLDIRTVTGHASYPETLAHRVPMMPTWCWRLLAATRPI